MARARMVLDALVVLTLSASGMTRGLCFMPGAGEAGPRDAHSCCKTAGWMAAAPECCMTGAADEEPARTGVPVALAAPAAVRVGFAQPLAASRLAGRLDPDDRSHSPPGRAPLRI